MRRMRICAGLLIAVVALTGAGASTAAADSGKKGKLKICVYGLDAGENATVSVDGELFGSYPADGKCETDKVRKNGYTIATTGNATLDEAEITDRNGRRTDDSAENINVVVYKGRTTRVNIFMT